MLTLIDWFDRQHLRVGFGLGTGGGGGGGSLEVVSNSDQVSLVTLSGAQTTLPEATGVFAGVMTAADKTKLNGLANTTVAVDPSNFETRAQVTATIVDPAITFIRTAGYHSNGDGGSAIYARRAFEPLHEGKVQSADGDFWELVPEHGVVNSKQFGEIGDGFADDTAAIQHTIDFAVYHNSNTASGQPLSVLLVGPTCRTTDTIHLGYGIGSFNGVVVRGTSAKRRSEPQNTGTAIIAHFSDRPVINVQGARQTAIIDIWLEGGVSYASIPSDGPEPLNEANWTAAGGDGRYNPHAGITIDAYSGARPAQSYPDVTYPAFFGAVTQYGKLSSSEVRIENVGMRGLNTGIAVQPCNSDVNGDFVKIVNVNLEDCKYGISIGNSQSRNVEVRNVIGLRLWLAFTNATHGKQTGRFGGPIGNCSFAGFIGRIFAFNNTAFLGTTIFSNLYTENTHRLGDFTSDSATEGALTFESCQLSFRHSASNGVPANILGGTNSSDIIFRACRFQNAPSVYSLQPPNISIDSCRVDSLERTAGTLPLYQAFAHNLLTGGLVKDALSLRPHKVRFRKANLNTGTLADDISTDEGFYQETTRDSCIPLPVWEFGRKSELYGEPRRKRVVYFDRTKFPNVHFNSVSLTGRTLLLDFKSLDDDDAFRFGVSPGDVIRDRNTGTTFFITSRNGTLVSAEAQSNYVDDGAGGFVQLDPFDTEDGGLQFMNARLYSPSFLTFGTFAQGSSTATAVGRADGFGGYLPNDVLPGDYIFADQDPDFIFANGEAEVLSIDTAAKTITFKGQARNSVTRKEMSLWIRQPPPNLSA